MIDIENEVLTRVANAVRVSYPNIGFGGEYVKSPSSFPFVSLEEKDNYTYQQTQTSSSLENHIQVMYEINVYSNKTSGKKSECKAIMAIIDREMSSLGFSRMMLQPIPNMDDATIYRITARYRAVVSVNKTIYRR